MKRMSVRVLVVDDSAFFRRIVTRCLESIDGIEVAGSASNGKLALQRLEQFQVDLVVLDVQMPEMDGLETLKCLRRLHPEVRVMMLSGHTRTVAENTISALLLGAEDFIVKPTSSNQGGDNQKVLREALSTLVLRQGKLGRGKRKTPTRAHSSPVVVRPANLALACEFDVLLIGSSTGGPRALSLLFDQLPKLSVPVLIAQHLPPSFSDSLARCLNARGAMEVREGLNGERLEPGVAYLAPGGFHMEVTSSPEGVVLNTHQGDRVNYCRPSVDVLFLSASAVYRRCLGLILTGMGYDGLEGSRAIVRAGGEVWSQDRESSVVWGMPKAVVEAGLGPELNLEQMVQQIGKDLNR